MDSIAQPDVRLLSEFSNGSCVSIFMPTHRAGEGTQQDPIRLRNLLRDAEEKLRATGRRTPDAAATLQPATALLKDHEFWQHQSDGLALLMAPGEFRRYRVPLQFDETLIVGRRFHLKPLFPFLTGDGRFYILALSRNEVRLLEATRHSVDEIDLEQLPGNLFEALGVEELQRQVHFHTRAAPRGDRRAAMFYGHGAGQEQSKDQVERFFRKIDQALCEFLRERRSPLVLAGVEYYFPMYRNVSHYAQLVEGGIAGNPELLGPKELHQRAWPLVEPIFERDREIALARYGKLSSAGRTTTGIAEILPAAQDGRVEVLFMAAGRQLWGAFDPESRQVVGHEHPNDQSEDLFDRAAVTTFLGGGTVYVLPPERVPEGKALAAMFRY